MFRPFTTLILYLIFIIHIPTSLTAQDIESYVPSYKFEYSTSQVIGGVGFWDIDDIRSGSLYMNEYCFILGHILEFGYSITKGDLSIEPYKSVLVNGVEVDKVSDMKFSSFFVGIRPEIKYVYMTLRIGLGNESYLTPVSSYNSKGIYLGYNTGLIIPFGPFNMGLKIGNSGIIHAVSSDLSDLKWYVGFDVSFDMAKIPKKIIVRKPKPIPPKKPIDRSKPTIQKEATPVDSRETAATILTTPGNLRTTVLNTAVVEFQEKGDLGIKDAGAIVAEWMSSSLIKTGAFTLYERVLLYKVLEEQDLGLTGALDEKTTAEIGMIYGVESIVTGTVSKFGNTISVVAKLIDTKTAKVIASSDVKTTSVDAIPGAMDRLARELAKEP